MVNYRTPEDWDQWVDQLAETLHARNRWRLSLLIMGIVFATGRRTVTSWLRAVGISDNFADYYYFLPPVGTIGNQTTRLVLASSRHWHNQRSRTSLWYRARWRLVTSTRLRASDIVLMRPT